MQSAFITLIIGIILLLSATKALIKISEKLSLSLKISPLIIGVTIVALGTSLPELAVSLIASAKGDSGLAIGNIIGSNIANILLVFPVGILIGKMRVGTTKTQKSAIMLLLVTAAFIVLHFLSIVPIYLGILFIVGAIIMTIAEFEWGVEGRTHEDAKKMKGKRRQKVTLGKIFILLLSIGFIALGGKLTVNSIEEISILTGYSTTVLGLTLTAVATSLPELLATIFSQEEHQEKITLGNILGSNIYNLLFIGGVTLIFSKPGQVSAKPGDWFMLALVTLIFFGIVRKYRGQKIPRWVAPILFLILIGYFGLLAIGGSGKNLLGII